MKFPLHFVALLLTLAADSAFAQVRVPDMAELPAGSFRMGEAGRSGAMPPHVVQLRAFAISRHEITQGEWRGVMGGNPSHFSACGDDCPVDQVSWQDAVAYTRRLSDLTGHRYRLPSEAEWEYACRAGIEQDFCGGDNPATVAWYGTPKGGPHTVAGKEANAWGLFDMSGNVWEWTQDCLHDDYVGAPTDGSAWQEDGCRARVLRGGSWLSGPQYARAALRLGFDPGYRSRDFGFRVVREAD
jgi:formylglycine-generating enzyme required for sulfatase activity